MQEPVCELIEKAAAEVGSEYKLAAELGISTQELSGIKHGRRPCPADVQAVMASITGGDPVSTLVQATAARLSEDRRTRLANALRQAGQLVGNF